MIAVNGETHEGDCLISTNLFELEAGLDSFLRFMEVEGRR